LRRGVSFAVWMVCLCLIPSLSHAQLGVRLAVVEHKPYIGPDLPRQGYAHEVLVAAFERVGYTVSVRFYPLARARRNAVRGAVDGWLSVQDDVANDARFVVTDGFPGSQIGLLKRKALAVSLPPDADRRVTESLRALASYRFGVVRGASVSPAFDGAGFIRRQPAASDLQNLDKLAAGRLDFAVIDKYAAAELMVDSRPHLIGTLEFLRPALATNSFRLALPRSSERHARIQADFNRGLAAITADGTLARIRARHGFFEPRANTSGEVSLVVGTVNNEDMLVMQSLSARFEAAHPGIRIDWRVLDENTLRRRLLSDLAISDGQFDVMTIGAYEAPIWGGNDWLTPVHTAKDYDLDDVLPSVRAGLSREGRLYALPFYAESSMLFYRKDWFAAAGLRMPTQPTWQDVRGFARILNAPSQGRYGICLRGKPGWGENITIISTMVNTHGGRWFDAHWHPQFHTRPWRDALTLYRDLLLSYGPPKASDNGFNENLALFAEGRCAMWVDATVAAGKLFNPGESKVADRLGFAPAPIASTPKGAHWLWTWALAVPSSSRHQAAAMDFIQWATSREYIGMVARQKGWVAVPPGTRRSTYENRAYRRAAPFSDFVLQAIESADPVDSTEQPKPYVGIQMVGIPEFTAIGYLVGTYAARMLDGDMTVDQVLDASQDEVGALMRSAGYE